MTTNGNSMLLSTGGIRPQAELISDLIKTPSPLKLFIRRRSHGIEGWEKICWKGFFESVLGVSQTKQTNKQTKW